MAQQNNQNNQTTNNEIQTTAMSDNCRSSARSRNSKSIVKRLEDGKVPLEESVAIYERGEALKRRCEDLLRQAEARVEKITLDATGKPTGTEPLDVE